MEKYTVKKELRIMQENVRRFCEYEAHFLCLMEFRQTRFIA